MHRSVFTLISLYRFLLIILKYKITASLTICRKLFVFYKYTIATDWHRFIVFNSFVSVVARTFLGILCLTGPLMNSSVTSKQMTAVYVDSWSVGEQNTNNKNGFYVVIVFSYRILRSWYHRVSSDTCNKESFQHHEFNASCLISLTYLYHK